MPALASRRAYALLLPTFATGGVILWRGAYAKAFTQPLFRHTMLVIGAGQAAASLAAKLRGLVGSQLQDSSLPDRIRVGEALELFAAISPGGAPWRRRRPTSSPPRQSLRRVACPDAGRTRR